MTPYRLGIAIGSSGGVQFKNYLATASTGMNAAGTAGRTGAIGVAAMGKAMQGTAPAAAQLMNRINLLRQRAAALQTTNQSASGGLQGLMNRLNAARMQAYRLQQPMRTSAFSVAGLGRAAQLTGGFMLGLARGGGMALQNLTGRMAGFVGLAAQGIFSLRTMAFTLGAGMLGGALIQSNRSTEQQQISMAALIKANVDYVGSNGKVMSDQAAFQESLKVSTNLMRQYRYDALKGAGSTEERITVTNATIQKIMGEAGGNLQAVRGLANEVVTTSKLIPTLAHDAGQAARDASLILSGNAGGEVQLFSFLKRQLGDASAFNKLAAPERLAKFRAAMQTLATPALIEAQANSFDGLTSSIGDFFSLMTQTLGGPLFAQVKAGLKGMVDYLVTADGSPTKAARDIETTVLKVGTGVGNAGAKLINFLATGIPKVVALGQQAYNLFNTYITPALEAVRPIAEAFIYVLSQGFQLISGSVGGTDTALRDGITTLAQLSAGAAAFVGLGLATVFAGIGGAIMYAVKGWGILTQEINKRGGDVKAMGQLLQELWEGVGAVFNMYVVEPVTKFFNGLVTFVSKGLDDTLMAILQFGRDSIAASQNVPLLGGAFGAANDLFATDAHIYNQMAAIENRRMDRQRQEALDRRVANAAQGVNVNVNQNITAPNPQVAAAAANRGVGVAVASNVPGAGKVGQPLVRSNKP